jgi:hypothetical protein
MKTVFGVLILIIGLSAVSFGQTGAKRLDEFAKLKRKDEQARFDSFARAVQAQSPHVYVLTYGGRNSCRSESKVNRERAKTQLIKLGIGASQIVIVEAGYKEEAGFELWVGA